MVPPSVAHLADSLGIGLDAAGTILMFGDMTIAMTPLGVVVAAGTVFDSKAPTEMRVLAGVSIVLVAARPASRAVTAVRGAISEARVGVLTALGSRVNVGGVQAIEMSGRLSPAEMATLQKNLGVEVAQIYVIGPGKNGGGGTYYLLMGSDRNVTIPVRADIRLIILTQQCSMERWCR